jgi:hypothetical protein
MRFQLPQPLSPETFTYVLSQWVKCDEQKLRIVRENLHFSLQREATSEPPGTSNPADLTTRSPANAGDGTERFAVGHTHARAAAQRTYMRRVIQKTAKELGLGAFAISGSEAEIKIFEAGNHYYYNPQDLKAPPRFAKPPPGATIVLIDVANHLTIDDFCAHAGSVFLISTVNPTGPSGKGLDSNWSIDAKGMMTEVIRDGTIYCEQVFDFPPSFILKTTGPIPGFVLYETVRHTAPGCESRALVGLVPRATCDIPLGIVRGLAQICGMSGWREIRSIRRFTPVETLTGIVGTKELTGVSGAKYHAMTVMVDNEKVLRVALPGVGSEVMQVGFDLAQALRRVLVHGNVPGASTVRNYAKHLTPHQAVLLADCLGAARITIVDPVAYVNTKDNAPATAKGSVCAVPLVTPASAAGHTFFAAARAIEQRLVGARSDREIDTETMFLLQEFSKYVADAVGSITPLDRGDAALLECVTRIREARTIASEALAYDGLTNGGTSAFLKSETVDGAAAKDGAARLIYGLTQETLIECARYIIPFLAAFKACGKFPGYVGGKNVSEVEEVVNQLVQMFAELDLTDYSKYDGTFNLHLTACVLDGIAVGFGPASHDARVALSLECNQTGGIAGLTPDGTAWSHVFEMLCAIASGGKGTHVKGTLGQYAHTFVALRMAGVTLGQIREDPWCLGISYGDDGVKPRKVHGLSIDYAGTGKLLGLVCVTEHVVFDDDRREDFKDAVKYVSFLGRVHPDPTLPASMATPHRALAGLCVTTNANPAIGGAAKAYAAMMTEGKNTLVYKTAEAYVRVNKWRVPEARQLSRDAAYKLANAARGGDLPDGVVLEVEAHCLGLEIADLVHVRFKLEKANFDADLRACRLEIPIVATGVEGVTYYVGMKSSIADGGITPEVKAQPKVKHTRGQTVTLVPTLEQLATSRAARPTTGKGASKGSTPASQGRGTNVPTLDALITANVDGSKPTTGATTGKPSSSKGRGKKASSSDGASSAETVGSGDRKTLSLPECNAELETLHAAYKQAPGPDTQRPLDAAIVRYRAVVNSYERAKRLANKAAASQS